MKLKYGVLVFLYFMYSEVQADSLRVLMAGNLQISQENQGAVSIPLSYVSSALIELERDVRFFRGIELELTVPQTYLAYQGSLAIAMYTELDSFPTSGIADIQGRQIFFEPIPNKIQTIYQIPLRPSHGLRSSPYVSVSANIIPPSSFPLLFRILPVIKGLSAEVENMLFQLSVKPLLSDEGAVRITPRYPVRFPEKPFTVLIDDEVIENPEAERLLKEGEHHLAVLSEDYRNESRRFLVERGKVLNITLELQDPTPMIVFEAPEEARVFFDGVLVEQDHTPLPVEPGRHEVKFQVSDYAVIKPITVERGKTYRVALSIDIAIQESE
jgi:hypothetical protein